MRSRTILLPDDHQRRNQLIGMVPVEGNKVKSQKQKIKFLFLRAEIAIANDVGAGDC